MHSTCTSRTSHFVVEIVQGTSRCTHLVMKLVLSHFLVLLFWERAAEHLKVELGHIHLLLALHGQPPRGSHRGAVCDLHGMPTCPLGMVRRGRRILHEHREPHSWRRSSCRGLQDAHTSWRSSFTPTSLARSSENGRGALQGELGHSHPSSCSSWATSSPRVSPRHRQRATRDADQSSLDSQAW